jgi:replicative DNA helicase
METRPKKAGKPIDIDLTKVPTALEAERGIASIAVNHPDAFVMQSAEKRFNVADILDAMSRFMCETVLTQASKSSSCDIRVVYEKVRERLPHVEFHQLSEVYTLLPIVSALPDLMEAVRSTAKRRSLLGLLTQANMDISNAEISTVKLISDLAMQTDSLSHELSPPRALDTKNLLMEAIQRYETGDDQTQRIRTGYAKLDNLTPTRYGDFMVIGGETKSGKTMLALNIIANIICNSSTLPHTKSTSTDQSLSQQDMSLA